MTVWSDGVDDLFASDLASDALYRVAGAGAGVAVRAVLCNLDEPSDLGRARSTTRTARLDVRPAQVMTPARNDTLTIADQTWRVAETPVKDKLGLVWQLYCHPYTPAVP